MAKKTARKSAKKTTKKKGSRPNVKQTTAIARKAQTPATGKGHNLLCEGLKLIYEDGIETRDGRGTPEERRDGHLRATVALRDGRRWGCAWAERI